jgi:hypothetical protein
MLAKPDERTHDFNIDFNGSLAVQYAGKHRHPLLRKTYGKYRRPPRLRFDITSCDLKLSASLSDSWNIKSD